MAQLNLESSLGYGRPICAIIGLVHAGFHFVGNVYADLRHGMPLLLTVWGYYGAYGDSVNKKKPRARRGELA